MIVPFCFVADWVFPAASAATSFLGGIFGNEAQRDANRTNLRIAQETNALNHQMMKEQMNYNTDMWNKTNLYNTPANQRKLLEQAGYNPALFSGNNTNASNISSPSANPAVTGAPVQPVNSLAGNISNAVGSAAQSMLWLNSARKEKAQAINEEINALTQGERNKAQLKSLKESAAGQQLDNMLKDLTMDSQVAASRQNVELLRQNTKNVIADTILKNVSIELEQEKVHLTQEETNRMKELVKNAILEGKNLITQGDLIKAGISETKSRTALNAVNAEMARIVGNSQAAANYASAEQSRATAQLTFSQKEMQDMENTLYKKYGKTKELAEILKMASESKLNDWQANKAAIEFLKIRREYKFLPVDRIADMFKAMSGAAMLLFLL